MKIPQVNPKIGLFIVVPVIVGMLITGIVMWPSAEEQEAYLKRKKEIRDSLKLVKELKISEEE